MTRAVLSHRLRAHRKLVQHTMNVRGKPASMHMIGNIVKLLKYGRIHHADDEVQAAVAVGNNGEDRRLSLSE